MTKMISSSVVTVSFALLLILGSVLEGEALTRNKNYQKRSNLSKQKQVSKHIMKQEAKKAKVQQEPKANGEAAAANGAANNAAAADSAPAADNAPAANNVAAEPEADNQAEPTPADPLEAPEDLFFVPGGDYHLDSNNPLDSPAVLMKLYGNDTTPTTTTTTTTTTTVNATENETVTIPCITREDSRASSWFSKVAAPGTECVFGVDPRDEGHHCIMEIQYGSFGWCWTGTEGKGEWGSCDESCPLAGHAKVLGGKIDGINAKLEEINMILNGTLDAGEANVTANATAESPANATDAAGGTAAAGNAPADAGKEAPAADAAAAGDAGASDAAAAPAKEGASASSSLLEEQQQRKKRHQPHHARKMMKAVTESGRQ